jgi:hypothetical protein
MHAHDISGLHDRLLWVLMQVKASYYIWLVIYGKAHMQRQTDYLMTTELYLVWTPLHKPHVFSKSPNATRKEEK